MAEDRDPFGRSAAPLASDANGRFGWMAQSGLFVLKCSVLAIIFWSLWLFVVRPMMSSGSSSSSSSQSSQSQDKEHEALMKAYWEQVRLADDLQAEYKRQSAVTAEQQKRMEAILTKQEELNRRFEAVIQRWEKHGRADR
jgi:hypothetical protein